MPKVEGNSKNKQHNFQLLIAHTWPYSFCNLMKLTHLNTLIKIFACRGGDSCSNPTCIKTDIQYTPKCSVIFRTAHTNQLPDQFTRVHPASNMAQPNMMFNLTCRSVGLLSAATKNLHQNIRLFNECLVIILIRQYSSTQMSYNIAHSSRQQARPKQITNNTTTRVTRKSLNGSVP